MLGRLALAWLALGAGLFAVAVAFAVVEEDESKYPDHSPGAASALFVADVTTADTYSEQLIADTYGELLFSVYLGGSEFEPVCRVINDNRMQQLRLSRVAFFAPTIDATAGTFCVLARR